MRHPRPCLAALTTPLALAAERVQLVPDGVFRATDGRPREVDGWRLSSAIAERLLARLRAKQTRLVINYEHPEPSGQPLPAAGWIEREQITYTEGLGLTAPVTWTARARAMLDAGEYAYLSPVISYDPATGAVVDLLLVGLTNTPALDTLAPLAALAERFGLDLPSDREDDSMDLAQLRQALGLAAEADESAILAQAAELATQAAKVAPLTEQVAALSARAASPGAPDLSGYVPRAVHEEALAALRRVQTDGQAVELASLVEQGLASGQIPGQATADWLKGRGIAALRQYLADAPAVAALRGTQTQGRDPGAGQTAALTEEELAVCRQMRITPDAYRTAKLGQETTR